MRVLDVLVDREHFDQIERLEDEPERLQTQPGQHLIGLYRHVDAGDMHLAPARPIERAEHVEQGRFAGARGADQHREIALAQRQVDGVQRLDAQALIGLVNLGHAGEARDRRGRQRRAFDVCECGERRSSNDLRRRGGHARFHSCPP